MFIKAGDSETRKGLEEATGEGLCGETSLSWAAALALQEGGEKGALGIGSGG